MAPAAPTAGPTAGNSARSSDGPTLVFGRAATPPAPSAAASAASAAAAATVSTTRAATATPPAPSVAASAAASATVSTTAGPGFASVNPMNAPAAETGGGFSFLGHTAGSSKRRQESDPAADGSGRSHRLRSGGAAQQPQAQPQPAPAEVPEPPMSAVAGSGGMPRHNQQGTVAGSSRGMSRRHQPSVETGSSGGMLHQQGTVAGSSPLGTPMHPKQLNMLESTPTPPAHTHVAVAAGSGEAPSVAPNGAATSIHQLASETTPQQALPSQPFSLSPGVSVHPHASHCLHFPLFIPAYVAHMYVHTCICWPYVHTCICCPSRMPAKLIPSVCVTQSFASISPFLPSIGRALRSRPRGPPLVLPGLVFKIATGGWLWQALGPWQAPRQAL